MSKLRVAIITDIHQGPDIGNKLGTKALGLLERFVKAVNKYKPDCIVDMGDRVSCRNRETDMEQTRRVKDVFNQAAAPVHHLIGNHDARFMSRADNENINGSSGTSYAKDYGAYRLLFWNPTVNINGQSGLRLTDEDMGWLRDELAAADKKVILFSHVPLDNDPQDYQEEIAEYTGIAGRFYYAQGHAVRKMLEDSGKVALCMAGHRHTKRHREINGIHYITQQSLTSGWNGTRKPMGTYAYLEAEDDRITIMLQGRDKTKFDLKTLPQNGLGS